MIKQKFEALIKEVRVDFGLMLSPIIKQHSFIETITFTQYQLYFNDGEECPFRVRSDPYEIVVNSEYSLDGYPDKFPSEVDMQTMKKVLNDISDAIKEIPDDLIKACFGNHKKITINRDGSVIIEEYTDHD